MFHVKQNERANMKTISQLVAMVCAVMGTTPDNVHYRVRPSRRSPSGYKADFFFLELYRSYALHFAKQVRQSCYVTRLPISQSICITVPVAPPNGGVPVLEAVVPIVRVKPHAELLRRYKYESKERWLDVRKGYSSTLRPPGHAV
jgi:hypothetical protein